MKSICLTLMLLAAGAVLAGPLPGGGNGMGPPVTVVSNGNGTVTMSNGIVSLLINTAGAQITQINYTYNNGSGTTTTQMLNNGTDGGELYWETGGFDATDSGYFSATSTTVAANTGTYAEISMVSASETNGTMEVDFSMLQGSTGFYVTAIWSHRGVDGAQSMGETRDNIYAGAIFNWMSVDAARNRLMEVTPGQPSVGVLNAPVEVFLWTGGIYAGQYEDKYKYSANFGDQRVWGWSSVGPGGLNVGLWNVSASVEYHNDGPVKRELMEHIGTTILNMLNSTHYGSGVNDANWAAGEVWTKVNGPYFIYCNNITNTMTNMTQAASALYADALTQAAAEQTAWPYSWYSNANYAPAAHRGTVAGQMVINDVDNPNASATGLWVGVVQQPVTEDGIYDFQEWMKTYQFWVKSDTNGNFTIPNVIAGSNYTLYAFGPGAAGTFQSQYQNGGNSPNTFNLPATPFSVTVQGGVTTNLGAVTWSPTRVGPTVFEIGYPDRMGDKFRHGDDYWVGDIGPSPTSPSPIWSKHLEYPFDFPNGPNYAVGQSIWCTDWNYVQPIVVNAAGGFDDSSSTITFNLPSAPASGASASIYLALASDFQGAIILQVNGEYVTSDTGYYANYGGSGDESDTTIRQGIHGAFSDNRTTFAGGLLQAGQNTITISIRQVGGSYFADHAMYDYVRLELAGYMPPAPASVAACAGNNCNLVCWPVTPGATSYNLLRSTNSAGGYVSITNGVLGPVCGCGPNNATYLDANAVNGTTYYYVVSSLNPAGSSPNSPPSPGATPSAGIATNAPSAPAGLSVAGVGHQSVTLNWNASPGANFYAIQRSTVVNNGDHVYVALGTNTLNNSDTNTTYTDTSPTDGSIYSYMVTATSAGGASGNSASVTAVPLPAPPAAAPGSLTGSFEEATNVLLDWSPASGAVGYIITRATSPGGPFTFVMSVTETTYTDTGLNNNITYYYQIAAVNAAGVSSEADLTVLGAPVAPGLTAIPGNAQVLLTWSEAPGATNYVLQSSTTNGGPYAIIVNTTRTSYTNTGLMNGATYYYVVYSQGPNGQSPLSVQAGATPTLGAAGFYWTNIVTTSAQSWNLGSNWNIGTSFPNGAQTVAFVNSAISTSQTIDLNQAVTVGALSLGAGGGAFTIAPNGGTLAFNNASSAALLVELPASRGDTLSAPMTVSGSLIISNSSSNTLALSGNISGGSLVVTGNTLLSGTNTYTGGTMFDSGSLVFSAGSAIPASGALTLSNTAAVTVTTANSLPNVVVGGSNSITGNGNSGTGLAALNDAGTLTLFVSGGSDVFDLTGAMSGSGNLVLGNAAMTLRFNGTTGDGSAVFNLGAGAAVANVRSTGTTAIALGGLTGGSKTQLQGDNSSGGNNMTYTLGGASANTEFDGVIVNGTVGTVTVVKTGTNSLTLTGSNTYSGGTTLYGGVLQINNAGGSGTGTGAVTVASGGALGGNGIISGPVTVNVGGSFAPGNPLGALTISNNLTLNSGSATFVQVEHSPLTNGAAKISGTLTEGGTLNVTNIGAAVLVAGDTFKLFKAANYGGSFSPLNLPPLTGNLAWNTNELATSGALSVFALTSPTITGFQVAGANLTINGSGGVSNWLFYIETSTNLASSQWTPIATNQFSAAGSFSATLTNAIQSNQPPTFFRLQLP